MFIVFTVVMGLLAVRVAYIQIAGHEDLSAAADMQQKIVLDGADARGAIYDRNGTPIVGGYQEYIYVIPAVKFDGETQRALNEVDAVEVVNQDTGYKVFASQDYDEQAGRCLLNNSDAYIMKAARRYCSNQPAVHMMGYVNSKDCSGVSGLELMYEDELKSYNKKVMAPADVSGKLLKGYGLSVETASDKDPYTMNEEILDEIVEIVNIRFEEPMAKHTTFQIGGQAQYFVTPGTTEEIRQILKLCKEEEVPYFVMGRGSNLLVSDAGMEGVVLQLYDNYSDFSIDGNQIQAQAGVMLSKIGYVARENSLTGFEFAAGIPGTLGGAVMMNAGAYGGEMKDIIATVQLMDEDGNLFEKTGEEMDFAYRHSIVEEKNLLVLGATLTLQKGDKEAIDEKMKELASARKTKQPLEFPSAGSTFKRPEGYFAGKLIMDAGLRGYQVGGAQVSEKHCGFVINKKNATAADVLKLVSDVKAKVYEEFQVELEPEVRLVGRQ